VGHKSPAAVGRLHRWGGCSMLPANTRQSK